MKIFRGKRGEGNPSIFTDVALSSVLGNGSKSLSLGAYLIGQQPSQGLLPITGVSSTHLPVPSNSSMLNTGSEKKHSGKIGDILFYFFSPSSRVALHGSILRAMKFNKP